MKRRGRNVYRERYQDYSRRVRERPEFADVSSRVIDVAIAIVLFKELVNQDERARILSQSDQIQEWRDTLDKSEFLDQSSEYLTKVEVEAEQNPLEPVTFLFFLFLILSDEFFRLILAFYAILWFKSHIAWFPRLETMEV